MKANEKEANWVKIITTIYFIAETLGFTQKDVNDMENAPLTLSLIRYLLANIYDIEEALSED